MWNCEGSSGNDGNRSSIRSIEAVAIGKYVAMLFLIESRLIAEEQKYMWKLLLESVLASPRKGNTCECANHGNIRMLNLGCSFSMSETSPLVPVFS